MNNNKRLIIIGGGYAGTTLVHKLKSYVKLEVVLINKTPYHLAQTDIHKYLCDELQFNQITYDLKSFTKKNNASFICQEVKDIHINTKEVLLENDNLISYDYLCIATGSLSLFPKQIKNIKEYSQDIKDIPSLQNYKEEFDELLKLKKNNKNITIIGGGLSGVEIALELAKKLKTLNIKEEECSVSLVEQLPTILPNMDNFFIENTIKACDALNIKRYHGFFVNEIKDKKVYLSNGKIIDFDLIFCLIGVESQKLISDETIKVNFKNQIIVDEYLRIKNKKEIFVLGDIAQTQDKYGNFILPTAQMAKLHAGLTAKNIINTIENKKLYKNELKTKGLMIDLSGFNAVGMLEGIKIKGFIAYMLKRLVSKIHTRIFKKN